MRKFLFKGKRKYNGAWVIGDLVQHKNGRVYINVKTGNSAQSFEVIPDTVCQFTGLTDKNGAMIWEHDAIMYHGGDSSPVAIIKFGICPSNWGEKQWGFHCNWITEDEQQMLRTDLGFWVENRIIEVIGNIFDNPELL